MKQRNQCLFMNIHHQRKFWFQFMFECFLCSSSIYLLWSLCLCVSERMKVYICVYFHTLCQQKLLSFWICHFLLLCFFLTVQRLHIFCFCKQFLLFVFLRNLFKCAAIEAAIKFSDSMIRWFTGTFPLVHTH